MALTCAARSSGWLNGSCGLIRSRETFLARDRVLQEARQHQEQRRLPCLVRSKSTSYEHTPNTTSWIMKVLGLEKKRIRCNQQVSARIAFTPLLSHLLRDP